MRAAAWNRMIITEGLLVWRDPAGVFLPMALPVLVILMHGLSTGDGSALDIADGLTAVEYHAMPSGLVLVLTILGFVNLPSFVAAYRKAGVLRRLAVTPAHPSMILAAQVIVNAVLGVIGILVGLIFARVFFDLQAPRDIPLTVGASLLIGAAMYGIGLVIAAVVPSSSSATAFGLVLFLILGTIGGGTIPSETLPETVATIGSYTPFGAGITLLQDGWVGRAPDLMSLAVLGGTTVVSVLLSLRLFRWK